MQASASYGKMRKMEKEAFISEINEAGFEKLKNGMALK